MALCWALTSMSTSLAYWGAHNSTQHSSWSLTSAEQRERIPSLHLLATLCPMQSRTSLARTASAAQACSWLLFNLQSTGPFLQSCFPVLQCCITTDHDANWYSHQPHQSSYRSSKCLASPAHLSAPDCKLQWEQLCMGCSWSTPPVAWALQLPGTWS